MTNQKHLKSRVRARMARTGESYASARAHVVAGGGPAGGASSQPGTAATHGVHAETTAIRSLATAAGVAIPEELALVVGGGLGAGAFVFHYPDFSSLYLAGQGSFDHNARFVRSGLERLGLAVDVAETGGAAAARRNLEEALANGPAIAWCDFVTLGTRGIPPGMAGGGYHVVVVRSIDTANGVATIEDLRPAETVELERLAEARARIAKDRNRVISVSGRSGEADLAAATASGLRAMVDGLRNPRSSTFGIGAFERLADRLTSDRGREARTVVFPRGRRLWVGLRSIYEFVETYGTGGGLMRPLFARGLELAATDGGQPALAEAAERYASIGREWSAFAGAALPASERLFAETRQALDARVDRFRAGATIEEMRWLSDRLDQLADEAADDFPLTEEESVELLADLAARLREIAAAERAALDVLEAAIG
ncbi:MAG TPA: DUF4872 domain-containing protein [Candidatus Limnocylindrales bacterium]|nr:DUF4872 domain-containing protein [Candidatus Limnocylindrales bacterium]